MLASEYLDTHVFLRYTYMINRILQYLVTSMTLSVNVCLCGCSAYYDRFWRHTRIDGVGVLSLESRRDARHHLVSR